MQADVRGFYRGLRTADCGPTQRSTMLQLQYLREQTEEAKKRIGNMPGVRIETAEEQGGPGSGKPIQIVKFADILRIYRSDSSKQTEELMQIAQGRKQKEMMQLKQQEQEFEAKKLSMIEESKDRDVERQSKLIVLKERERRETEIQKQTVLSLGFNEDKDLNDNGTPDVIELMNYALDKEKLDFEKVKFDKQYLDQQSLMFDIKIIFLTIYKVVRRADIQH